MCVKMPVSTTVPTKTPDQLNTVTTCAFTQDTEEDLIKIKTRLSDARYVLLKRCQILVVHGTRNISQYQST
jgi:hypothetical protein